MPYNSFPHQPRDALSGLKSIVRPPKIPEETSSEKGWLKVQERLGLTLPADYKDLIDCYGTGFLAGWILPYNPFAKNETMNLFWILNLHHQSTNQIRGKSKSNWSIVAPYQLYPEPGGLLPWGRSSSFEITMFWQVEGKPDSWTTILYNLLRGEYEVWKYGLVDFLYRLYSRNIKSLLLPELKERR
jgi:hypothetical protein